VCSAFGLSQFVIYNKSTLGIKYEVYMVVRIWTVVDPYYGSCVVYYSCDERISYT